MMEGFGGDPSTARRDSVLPLIPETSRPWQPIPDASSSRLASSMPVFSSLPPIPSAFENPLSASESILPTRKSLVHQINEEVDRATELFGQVVATRIQERRASADGSVDSPRSERPKGQMSVMAACLSLLKAMLGPVLLYSPRMFAEAGMAIALGMFLLAGAFSLGGMFLLIEAHDTVLRSEASRSNAFSAGPHEDGGHSGAFAQIGKHASGPIGYFLVEACLVVSQWLYCVGYPIFVAKNLQQVLVALLPQAPSLVILTLAQLPILVPYCWVRDIHYLGYPMLLANICLWGSLIIVLYEVGCTLVENNSATHGPVVEWAILGTGTLLFSAQAVVAFEGIALVLPIREAMREPHRFNTVIFICMGTATFALLLTGASAYAAFGEDTATFVTLNLTGPLGLCVRGVFSLSVVLTYPLQLYPTMQALEDRLGLSAPPGAPPPLNRSRLLVLQCLARTVLVVAAFAFSLIAPYDNLVALAGGLCAVPLAFIFPAYFHLRLCSGKGLVSKIIDVALMSFGLVMSPVAIVAAIMSWH